MRKNLTYWPPGLPLDLELPQTSVDYNLEVSARRYPDRNAILYYGNAITYRELDAQVNALAGFLQHRLGVAKGDRVALFLQNSPQFVISFYAVLRIGAVVVPVNTMNLLEEVRHIVTDSAANVAIFGQELGAQLTPLLGHELRHAVSVCYCEYLPAETDLPVPEVVRSTRVTAAPAISWQQAVNAGDTPDSVSVGPEDLAVIPYTSGTTGKPKGCMHTHRSVMHTTIGSFEFCQVSKDQVVLAALPMFHVTGLQLSMNAVIYGSVTMILMTRWDRRCAALLIARYRVTAWTAIPTMLIDFLAQPELAQFDLTSMRLLTGGGAAMPKSVAERIQSLWGLPYIEGYGLSETIATTHTNPMRHPKAQCLGIPIQGTTAAVVNPETLQVMPDGEVGEIILRGPQVFSGYWGNPEATAAAFIEVDGERYFRTGDLGYQDAEGYFFLVDRLKRMINVSGFKVWPAEIEALLYGHPAIHEACVIAARDSQRGSEIVKLVVVLKPGAAVTAEEIITWSRQHMAAYKVPHQVQFIEKLPKSGAGKVLWRVLQEQESAVAP